MLHITEQLPKPATRWGRRLLIASVVGVVAGLAAALLDWAIRFGSGLLIGRFTHFGTADFFHFDWRVILLPAGGALLSGLLVLWLGGRSRGHGVDILTRAFHRQLGHLPLRGPAVKGAGAALVISSGGSAGPEGPIAALGAAIGSWIAGRLPLTPQERRLFLIAGCAAGIGAIFRCPLGGALFATSILYREPEFESDAIVPSFVASVVGYSTYMFFWGFEGPMLRAVEALRFTSPLDLPWYAALGLLCGLVSIFFFYCMRTVEFGVVRRIRLPRWALPPIGGLLTGLLACLLPQVMDAHYLFLQNALDGGLFDLQGPVQHWTAWALLFGLVALAKCVATAFTVGSGAPGGILGPSVFIGGAVGACLGAAGHALFPETFSDELRLALIPVGMAGVLAATMRVPIAAIVMTMEMTGSFGLVAPLMLVCIVSYLVGRRWGLNDEQVRTSADSPTHAADPIVHRLESWRVRDIMRSDWPMTVSPSAALDEIIAQLEPGSRPVIAVAEEGRLHGVISAADLGNVLAALPAAGVLIAADIMTTNLVVVQQEQDAYSALSTFTRVDHATLPVMSSGRDPRWVGMLSRRDVIDKLHRELERSHEAAFREHVGLRAIRDDVRLDQLIMGLPAQHADVQRLFVPIDAIGKSLRECDFRRQYNAQVIAIEERDGSLQCPPNLDRPLSTDLRLLAVVWKLPAS